MCSRPTTLLFIAVLVGAGCGAEASTLVAPEARIDPDESLSLRLPDLTPGRWSPTSGRSGIARVDGPDQDVDDFGTESPDGIPRPPQRIADARTTTGLWPGRAWAEGANEYVGNVGVIRTTARVSFGGQPLAEQPVSIQDHVPFIFDFGRPKFITAFAPVSTDHTCGLTVRGDSEHRAYWQFFTGVGAPAWGEAVMTTVAEHSSQSPCPNDDPDPLGIDGAGPAGSTCYFRITYDLETGRVISTELLYCTPSTGEGL